MAALLLDLMPVWFWMISVTALTAVAVAALPWRAEEVEQTLFAWQHLWQAAQRRSTTAAEALSDISPDQLIPPPSASLAVPLMARASSAPLWWPAAAATSR
jgi:hypothetical protein